jgi:hypothetical protein
MRGVSFRLPGMPTFRRSLSRRALLAAPTLAAVSAPLIQASANSWPTKPVHITVPFAPGGSGDITARLVGKYIEDKTGQPFVIENKPGANGIVGVLSVKSRRPTATPDAGHDVDQRREHPHVQEPGLRSGEGLPGGRRDRLERRLLRRAGRQPLQVAGRPGYPRPRPTRAS